MIAKSNRAPEQSPIFANYLTINSLNNHIKFIFKPRLAAVFAEQNIKKHLLFFLQENYYSEYLFEPKLKI
jgi:hypothetical protein